MGTETAKLVVERRSEGGRELASVDLESDPVKEFHCGEKNFDGVPYPLMT
ncbi:hypothetical protein GJ633_00040 [Halorubrum sp. CBA1125]|nr:hypothetical protein [Halorubrum sp. CBA1125]MUW13213.1 hypothetical protein [Halorubrum sp. CBA1125]